MRSKKAIVWSTLIGITIASLILINVIVPILAAGYRILFPEPNYSSLQGFDRLSYAAMNAPYNGKMIVPIDLENGLKITTNANDPNCAINCLCLCKADGFASGQKQPGCLIRMYKETCFDSPVNFHGQFSTITPGVMINVVAILQVSRSTSAIDVTGEYSGKCYFDNYADCAKAGDCFVKFATDKALITAGSSYIICMACTDNLPKGQASGSETGDTQKVSCERYSYHELKSSAGAAISGILSYERTFSLPQNNPNIAQAKQQCETDNPCKLAVKCKWVDSTNSCVEDTSAASQPAKP